MVKLSIKTGTDEYQAYDALIQFGKTLKSLNTGCHKVNYSSEKDGPQLGAGDQELGACETWDNLVQNSSNLSSTVITLFGESPSWFLPLNSIQPQLKSKLGEIDKEIQRLQTKFASDSDKDLKIAQGLYDFVTSVTGLGILSKDEVRDNPATTVLLNGDANCSEYFSLFQGIFNRAGLSVSPVFVFESSTGDRTPHIATAFKYGAKTYLIDPFYNGFDTPHRRWAPLTLREFWSWYFNNKAQVEADAGNWKSAEKFFKFASRLDPYNPHFLNNLGVKLEENGKKTEAEAAYRKAISIDSKFIEPYLNLGALFIDTGKNKEALIILASGLKLNGSDPRILHNLALANFRLKNIPLALNFIDKAIQINNQNADYFDLRGDIKTKQNKLLEAQTDYNRAVQLKNSNP